MGEFDCLMTDMKEAFPMSDLTLTEMQQMQQALQTRYLAKWGGLSPEKAVEKLLWLHGEVGEASDVIKKHGSEAIMDDPAARQHFIEEMGDVLMYFNDVLICFGISPEEFAQIYRKKYERNMNRW